MDLEIIKALKKIVGDNYVDAEQSRVDKYSREHTLNSYQLIAPAPCQGSIIVKPQNAAEIAQVMSYAYQEEIPVIAKGAGTALAANAIPQEPSLILSLERLNQIIEVDEANMMLTTEAGCTLGGIIDYMSTHPSLYFPLHPGDEGAQIGGMAAMNAGGVRAVRHGVMRDQVKGLEVVLPTGELVNLGGREGKLLKDNAGYSLLNLLIGSEGTLGIITKVILKLYPRPKNSATLIASFAKRKKAFQTVPLILEAGYIPLAIEYVERKDIIKTAADLKKQWPADQGNSDLIIILSESQEDDLFRVAEGIGDLCFANGAVEILIGQTNKEQREIMEIRSHVLPAIEKEIVDCPDITVPRSKLPQILDEIDQLSQKYNTEIPILAHAGDGNLHAFILKENGGIPPYFNELKTAMYQKTLDLGGTITGEHGIGSLRLKELAMQFSPKELSLFWGIKKVFDPKNLLNPGKKVIPFN